MYIKIKIFMRESFTMVKQMGMVYIFKKMEQNMKVSSPIINLMGEER